MRSLEAKSCGGLKRSETVPMTPENMSHFRSPANEGHILWSGIIFGLSIILLTLKPNEAVL